MNQSEKFFSVGCIYRSNFKLIVKPDAVNVPEIFYQQNLSGLEKGIFTNEFIDSFQTAFVERRRIFNVIV